MMDLAGFLRCKRHVGAALLGLALPGMVLGNVVTYVPLLLGLILLLGKSGWKDSLREVAESPLMAVVVLFLVWLLAGSVEGMNPAYSVRHWKVLVAVAGVGFLLWHVLRQLSPEEGMWMWRWMAGGVLASFVVALVVAFGEPLFLKWGLYDQDNAWTQTRLRFYSSVLAVILPFCWVFWLRDGAGVFRMEWRRLALCGFSVVMVIVCAGRAGWLGVAASAAVCGVLLWRYYGLKMAWGRLTVTAAATALAGGFAYTLIYGLDSVKERVGVTVPERGLGGGRLDIWHLAWEHMFDKPLLGIGVNGFRFLPGADYHPHNFLLQLGLEGGLVGLGLGLLLLGLVFRKGLTQARSGVMAVGAFSGLAGFVVCGLTNKSVFNPEWLVFLVVPAALMAVRVVNRRA